MWLPFLLIVGVIAVVASSSSARGEYPAPPRQLAPPGPISVLGEFVRIGQVPPPPVIICAIAEAESLGRCDLASDIVRTFIAPVVHQHELANARPVHARGSCALSRSVRAVTPPFQARRTAAPVMPAQHAAQQESLPEGFPASDEEIRALLDSDPERFMAMAMARRAPVEQSLKHMVVDTEGPADTTANDHVTMPAAVLTDVTTLPIEETMEIPPAPSPLAGVPDAAWQEFCQRLVREAPNYQSARHVGQYRQRRERLAELGIDPNALGSVDAQRAALDVDLVDAHRHAADGGLLSSHLGQRIMIPGREAPETITLSGVLGVIQCAGLEGAAGWLESQRDRKRFPHTTQAFLRTNGGF